MSYDTAALLFWRVLHFLLVFFQNNTTHCRMASIIIMKSGPAFFSFDQSRPTCFSSPTATSDFKIMKSESTIVFLRPTKTDLFFKLKKGEPGRRISLAHQANFVTKNRQPRASLTHIPRLLREPCVSDRNHSSYVVGLLPAVSHVETTSGLPPCVFVFNVEVSTYNGVEARALGNPVLMLAAT